MNLNRAGLITRQVTNEVCRPRHGRPYRYLSSDFSSYSASVMGIVICRIRDDHIYLYDRGKHYSYHVLREDPL